MIASFGLALLAGVCVLCLGSRAEAAAKKAPVFSEIPGVTTPLVAVAATSAAPATPERPAATKVVPPA